MKILLMTFVTMSLFQDRVRLRWLYMVPALGLGFYGVKGALWVLRTGGGGGGAEGGAEGQRVFGPDMSFFADANDIGPALCMILPILLYLSREEERPWLKRIFQIAFGLSIISVIFTFSRGAFLGLAVVFLVLDLALAVAHALRHGRAGRRTPRRAPRPRATLGASQLHHETGVSRDTGHVYGGTAAILRDGVEHSGESPLHGRRVQGALERGYLGRLFRTELLQGL